MGEGGGGRKHRMVLMKMRRMMMEEAEEKRGGKGFFFFPIMRFGRRLGEIGARGAGWDRRLTEKGQNRV